MQSKAQTQNKDQAQNKRQNKKRSSKKPSNKEFAFITYFFLILFCGMLGYFVYFQVVEKEEYISSPYNSLQDLYSARVIRGDIIASGGEILATTELSEDGEETRVYPYGTLFSHVVGYGVNGKAGLEKQENYTLLSSHQFVADQIMSEIQGEKTNGDNVYTTLDLNLQAVAYDALGDYDGAVVVMEPSTGKILAMVSKPDFNPNRVVEDWEEINEEGSSVLFNRATQGKYTPGSVFKIVTALEYYRENPDTYGDFDFDCDSSFTADGRTINCASNKSHGDENLIEAFGDSCNSAFASLSLELDKTKWNQTAKELLFGESLPIDFPHSISSFSLSESADDSTTMETGIGQGTTTVSPLHMALISSAICNNGVLMEPYLVDHTESADGEVLDSYTATEYGALMTEKEAEVLENFMRQTVLKGTATKLKTSKYEAYGKTGTAQISDTEDTTNAWFTGYIKVDGKEDLAIAVVVEDSGSGSKYAVPIAKKVFDAYVK